MKATKKSAKSGVTGLSSAQSAKMTKKIVSDIDARIAAIDAEEAAGGAVPQAAAVEVPAVSPGQVEAEGAQQSEPETLGENQMGTHKKSSRKGSKSKAPGRKQAKAPKAPKVRKPRKVSGLDAAAQVLQSATKPLTVAEIMERVTERKLWKSPNGKTPDATIAAAIGREIAAKKGDSRFKKEGRGLFSANRSAIARLREEAKDAAGAAA